MTPLKETYFTPENLASKAQDMLDSLAGIQRPHGPFLPGRSALLALDLQAYFLDPTSHAFVPSAPAILPGINALIQVYTQRGLPLILTRHLNTPENAGLMATWWRETITADNQLSKLDRRIEPGDGVVIEKSRYDAFFDSPLEYLLRQKEVSKVVICGVMTHLCCETTARSAFMRGFEVFFTVDGTATYTEAHHRASLLNLAHGFATPVLVSQVLEALDDR